MVKEFCVRRTYAGWTFKEVRIGPLWVEDLDMYPDPAMPGQEVRFRVKLRNDGTPIRGNIRIQDRDQTIVTLNDAHLSYGHSEFHFPYTRYAFQRFDHCFTVIVDVERTPYRTDAAREFCAKPLGWTLRPSGHGIPDPKEGEPYILPRDVIADYVTREKDLMARSIYKKLSDLHENGEELAEKLWSAWKQGRNEIFHYFPK